MPNLVQKARNGRIDALKFTMARRSLLLESGASTARPHRKIRSLHQPIHCAEERNLFAEV